MLSVACLVFSIALLNLTLFLLSWCHERRCERGRFSLGFRVGGGWWRCGNVSHEVLFLNLNF